MPEPLHQQILKCRDDSKPIYFEPSEARADEPLSFRSDASTSLGRSGEPFGPKKLRSHIEPWLTALCQSEHLSLLLGSGLSSAVYRLATGDMLSGMGRVEFGNPFAKWIDSEARRSAESAGRDQGNLEDQIRVGNELLRGLEIMNRQKLASELRECIGDTLKRLLDCVLEGERGLLEAEEDARQRAFEYLVSFLMSFASRSGTRDRLHVFTTNYDRFIEAGADLAGLHLLDRFVGSIAPIFRSSRLDVDLHYNPPGIRGEPRYLEGVARFTKLHGSVDWLDHESTIRRIAMPFGATEASPFLVAAGKGVGARQSMIYPNSAKDRETAAYPYVELFRDFAAAACRPNHTLMTYGYSFGDEHINRVIEDMLTIPSTHLVVIAYGDPLGRIMSFTRQVGRGSQISLLIGDHLGALEPLVDHYLPKPAIDRTSFRMAELLKNRWTRADDATAAKDPTKGDAG